MSNLPPISFDPVDFTPVMREYSGQGAFRFWCQTVLPLVYDDSLSYYELLNKVVTYLNKTIEDVGKAEDNIDSLNTSFGLLQNEYNLKTFEAINRVNLLLNEFTTLKNYVDNYFDNLDTSAEIEAIMDNWVESGEFSDLLYPVVNPIVQSTVPTEVANWLNENVDPVGSAVVVDSSLTVSGAAADAKVTGDKIGTLTENVESLVRTPYDSIILTPGRWSWGVGINPSTGGNNTTRYAARTAFTQVVRPLLIELDSSDYVFDVYLYASGTYTDFIKRVKGAYDSENVMIAPFYDYVYYRVCVQRVDHADMTSGIDDPTSDEYKVLKQFLKVTTNTDETLSLQYVPADAKAVGDAIADIQEMVVTDETLSQESAPADAKAVGDAIDALGAKIRVMQYNVGKFRWGYVYSGSLEEWGLTEEQYKEKLKNYKKLFAKYQPDIAGFQEWAYYMDKAQTHQTTAVLLDDVYKYVHPISANANVLIAGNEKLTNGRFVTLHGTKEDNVTVETFNWYLVDFKIGTRTICIATGALSATSLSARTGQITELCATHLADYNYAIILSDLNSSLKYENGVLVDNTLGTVLAITNSYGYYPCQSLDGYWGATESYVRHQGVSPDNIFRCLDNILVKGDIKVTNFEVLTDEYNDLASDHIPVIADLYIY